MLATKEIITKEAAKFEKDSTLSTSLALHNEKLRNFYGRENKDLLLKKIVSRLDINEPTVRLFPLVVPAISITNFKYHASIKRDPVQTTANQKVIYLGDIPDFAIDRMQMALNSTFLSYISIHSNEKLKIGLVQNSFHNPLKAFIDFLTDPVIIGWESDPNIKLGSFTGKLKGLNALQVGYVLAMWGNEGQPL